MGTLMTPYYTCLSIIRKTYQIIVKYNKLQQNMINMSKKMNGEKVFEWKVLYNKYGIKSIK